MKLRETIEIAENEFNEKEKCLLDEQKRLQLQIDEYKLVLNNLKLIDQLFQLFNFIQFFLPMNLINKFLYKPR